MINNRLAVISGSRMGANYCVPAGYDPLGPYATNWDTRIAKGEYDAGTLPKSRLRGMNWVVKPTVTDPEVHKALNIHIPSKDNAFVHETRPGATSALTAINLPADERGYTPYASIDNAHLALPWAREGITQGKNFYLTTIIYGTDFLDPMHLIRYNLNHEKTEYVSVFVKPDIYADELAVTLRYNVNGQYMESAATYFESSVTKVPALSLFTAEGGIFGLHVSNETLPRLQFTLPSGIPKVCEGTTIDLCYVDPGSIPNKNNMLKPGDGIRITHIEQYMGDPPV